MSWISVNRQLPALREIVTIYRESPNDAQPMLFTGDGFLDQFGEFWELGCVTHWRPAPEPS